MLGNRVLTVASYLLVGAFSLALAVVAATTVLRPATAQDVAAPTDASAPQGPPAQSPPPQPPPPPPPTAQAPDAEPPDERDSGANDGMAPEGAGPDDIGMGGAQAPVQAASLPEDVSFLEPFVFDIREGRRNPFLAPAVLDGGFGAEVQFPGMPLERYELDELKLIGIMWDVRSPRAMFLDPTGEVHTLGKDDRIGRRRGYVAVIREGEVVVVETTNFSGESVYSTRVLRIER